MKVSLVRSLAFLAFCLISFPLLAQQNDDLPINVRITPPSPTPAALGKYGDMPVSYYTGIPQISVPLFEVKDGNLSVPVSLSYHAGGNKAEEKPSWAGRGWSLNAGGVITRVVRGLPDEMAVDNQLGYTLVRTKIQDLVAGNYTEAQKNFFYVQVANGFWDTEPDQYFYNFAGYSGRLFFNDQDSVITAPAQNWKIDGSLSGFGITDEKGMIYSFGQAEINEREDACELLPTPPTATSWYLVGITSPSGEQVVFDYDAGLTYHDITPSESDYKYMGGGGPGCTNMNNTGCKNMNRTSTWRLSTISAGKTKLKFNARTKRTDLGTLSNEYRLDDIELFYNDTLIRKTRLYFNGTSMRLDSLQEYGYAGSVINQKQPYRFNYFSGGGGPNVKSQDHWGFYSTKSSGLIPEGEYGTMAGTMIKLPGSDRSADYAGTIMGVLNKITYPTKGYTEFAYELNDYGFISTDSLQEKEILDSSTADLVADPSTITSEEVFVIDHTQFVDINYRVNIGPDPNLPYPSVNEYVRIVSVPGNTIVFQAASGQNRTYKELYAGTYKAIAYSENDVTSTGIQVLYEKYGNPLLKKKAGGLRVTSTTDYDGINHANDVVKTYRYTMEDDPFRSSGVIMTIPKYDYYYTIYKPDGAIVTGCPYYVRQSVSHQLGTTQGGHIGYRQVSVSRSDGARSVYTFSSFYDYPDVFSTGFPFPLPTSYDHKRGLLLSAIEYKKSGSSEIPVRKVRNHYYRDASNHYQTQLALKIGFSKKNPQVLTQSLFKIGSYDLISQWQYMDSTITTTFGPTGTDSLTEITAYRYDNPVHMQQTRQETTKSSGEKQTAIVLYPMDYITGNAVLDAMKNKHLIGYPVESVMYEAVGAAAPNITKGSITQYKAGGLGIKAGDLKLDIAAPVPLSAFKFSNRAQGVLPFTGTATGYAADSRYRTGVSYDLYDVRNNIQQYTVNGTDAASVIWDYEKRLPVATVKNAVLADIAYTSFETTETGGWSIQGGTIVSTEGVTGTRAFNINTGSITKVVPTGKKHLVTYWAKGNSALVNNTTATSVITKGAWKLYVHELSETVTNISVTGNVIIDELRLYPSAAEMITYAYKPLIGTTSQCDARNNIIYYEYDGLGRLSIIRDQDKKIVKMICYNYAGEPVACGN